MKKKVFAILGVVMYYLDSAIGGVILGFLDAVFELRINWESTFLLFFLALLFGLGFCYLFYFLLEKKWSKKELYKDLFIDSIGKYKYDVS